MISNCKITISDESQVGSARRAVQEICRRCGVDETRSGQAAIVVTELGHNLLRHAGGGEIILREIPEGSRLHIEVLAIDRGPGIANMSEAFRDGYSTRGTAGTGLGSARRLSDQFEVFTQSGRGTVVWAYFGDSGKSASYEVGGISVALESEEVCGDAWDVCVQEGSLRAVVVDGLGHGAFAHEAAREAIRVFRANPQRSSGEILELIHAALGKTRGAVGAIAELSPQNGEVLSAGVGNISMRLVGDGESKSLISDNGTLGGNVRRVQVLRQPWSSGTLLVMHSDGIASQWNLKDYPGLSHRHPSVIAGVLYRDLRRERDDATIVVIRHKT